MNSDTDAPPPPPPPPLLLLLLLLLLPLPTRLLDALREQIHYMHDSIRTEQTYVH